MRLLNNIFLIIVTSQVLFIRPNCGNLPTAKHAESVEHVKLGTTESKSGVMNKPNVKVTDSAKTIPKFMKNASRNVVPHPKLNGMSPITDHKTKAEHPKQKTDVEVNLQVSSLNLTDQIATANHPKLNVMSPITHNNHKTEAEHPKQTTDVEVNLQVSSLNLTDQIATANHPKLNVMSPITHNNHKTEAEHPKQTTDVEQNVQVSSLNLTDQIATANHPKLNVMSPITNNNHKTEAEHPKQKSDVEQNLQVSSLIDKITTANKAEMKTEQVNYLTSEYTVSESEVNSSIGLGTQTPESASNRDDKQKYSLGISDKIELENSQSVEESSNEDYTSVEEEQVDSKNEDSSEEPDSASGENFDKYNDSFRQSSVPAEQLNDKKRNMKQSHSAESAEKHETPMKMLINSNAEKSDKTEPNSEPKTRSSTLINEVPKTKSNMTNKTNNPNAVNVYKKNGSPKEQRVKEPRVEPSNPVTLPARLPPVVIQKMLTNKMVDNAKQKIKFPNNHAAAPVLRLKNVTADPSKNNALKLNSLKTKDSNYATNAPNKSIIGAMSNNDNSQSNQRDNDPHFNGSIRSSKTEVSISFPKSQRNKTILLINDRNDNSTKPNNDKNSTKIITNNSIMPITHNLKSKMATYSDSMNMPHTRSQSNQKQAVRSKPTNNERHMDMKPKSSTPDTSDRNIRTNNIIVVLGIVLISSTILVTAFLVYFKKISFSHGRYAGHMLLSTEDEDEDFSVFNRMTHDDYEPPYQSWKEVN